MPACKSTTLCVPARPARTTCLFVTIYIPGAACQSAKVQLYVRMRGMHAQLALPARLAGSAGQPAGQPIPTAPQ
jgi:hypothetical protein